MKIYTIITGFLVIALFQSCEGSKYVHFDKTTLYVFHQNDTLIYRSSLVIDTFKINNLSLSPSKFESLIYEHMEIRIQPLYRYVNDTMYSGYWDMSINRSSGGDTQITFRQFYSAFFEFNDSVISYTIGSYSIPNVHKRDNSIEESYINAKPVKTVYYNHNYGIIAYVLANGQTFELDEKYFKK